MAWTFEGSYVESCSCNTPCPCTASLSLGADLDYCRAVLGFNILGDALNDVLNPRLRG